MFYRIRNTRFPLTALVAVAAFSLVLIAACSDDDPVVPSSQSDPVISGTLGSAGGTLTSGDGTVEFVVPPGALTTNTEFSIKPLEGADIPDLGAGLDAVRSFSMTPAGLALLAPATLNFEIELPAAKGISQKEIRVPVALASAEFLDSTPSAPGVQEQLNVTIDQNNGTMQAALQVRGLSVSTNIVMVNGLVVAGSDPTLSTFHEWDEAPRMGSDFTSRVAFQVTDGMELLSDVSYNARPMTGLSVGWNDGADLTPDSEGELPNGYQVAFGAPVTPLNEGAADLKFEFEVGSGINWDFVYGELADHPEVEGNTDIRLILQDAALTVLPAETGGSDWLASGSYSVRVGLEGMSLMVGFEGFKYDQTVWLNGVGGTGVHHLGQTNSMASRLNDFLTPGQSVYEGFTAYYSFEKAAPTGMTFVQVGASGLLINAWNEEINDFGWSQLGFLGQNLTDGQPYDGNPGSGGFVLANNTTNLISLFEYSTEGGNFDQVGQISNYPESTGSVVSAAVRSNGSAIIVADGTPGRIYTHDRADVFAPAVYLGDAGDSPRRIRAAGNLAVISNFASDMITVLTWSNQDEISLVGMVPVGDGPVGIDLLPLEAGKVAVASTGFNDNTFTVTVLSAVGTVVSNATQAMPAGAEGPGHVVWLGDPDNRLMISCNVSGNVVVLDPGLD